jgi:hypothetical protein
LRNFGAAQRASRFVEQHGAHGISADGGDDALSSARRESDPPQV